MSRFCLDVPQHAASTLMIARIRINRQGKSKPLIPDAIGEKNRKSPYNSRNSARLTKRACILKTVRSPWSLSWLEITKPQDAPYKVDDSTSTPPLEYLLYGRTSSVLRTSPSSEDTHAQRSESSRVISENIDQGPCSYSLSSLYCKHVHAALEAWLSDMPMRVLLH